MPVDPLGAPEVRRRVPRLRWRPPRRWRLQIGTRPAFRCLGL